MNLLNNKFLLFLVRLFLGGMFIYAAVPKIVDPFSFAVDVYNYRLLPDFAVGLMAAGLPWLELIVGTMLIFGLRTRAACCIITGLLGVFTLAMFINTLRGIDVDCGCFVSDRSIGWFAVVEDLVFTLLGLWYLQRADGFWCLERLVVRRIPGR